MIRINLLPFRAARKRENVKRQITIYIASVCCALLIMTLLFLNYSKKLSDLEAKEGRLTEELAGYEKELKEIKDLEKSIKLINDKLDVIHELEKGKTGPVLLLSDIADAVPRDKLYLKSLTEKGGKLSLSGTAMDNETVADFIDNLEKTEQIVATPDLKVINRKSMPALKLTVSEFNLECKTYKAKKPAAKSTGKKKKKK